MTGPGLTHLPLNSLVKGEIKKIGEEPPFLLRASIEKKRGKEGKEKVDCN